MIMQDTDSEKSVMDRVKEGSQNNDVADEPDTNPSVRLPECLFLMADDSVYKGREREGKIGLKYGKGKSEWIWLSYMSMKKIIDTCKDNKELFNSQLKKEIQRMQVDEL